MTTGFELVMIIIRTFGAIALALFVSAANAHAADVVILSTDITKITDDPVCNLRLSGPIDSGDSTKIETIVDGVQQRSRGWSGIIGDSPTLCLNSPGGSYTEGLNIANLLLERHINDPSKQGVERRGNQTWIGSFGSEGSGYCVAQAPSPYGAPFGVSRNIIYDKKDRPKKDDFYIPYNWYLYPPATKIQSLE